MSDRVAPRPPLLALQGYTPEALARALPVLTLAEARKVVGAVHRDVLTPATFDRGVAGVRRVAMDELRARTHLPTLEILRTEASKIDPFVKLALRTHDGHVVETVRIPLEKAGRFSVCVSSQVGCALGCTFCATGRLGLTRNLEPWEIVEQVRLVKRGLREVVVEGAPARVHGVVFQGMGEPMANLDRVLQALEVLREPSALAIDARNVTVSTSGLPTGILRLAKEAPKVRLALSLGTVVPGERKRLLPIDAAHPLEEVLAAAAEHARATGLAPLWAVTLLAGVNDEDRHAQALAERLLRFAAETGIRPRLSVIPYNAIGDDDPYARTSRAREDAFREAMARAGAPTHKRYSGGGDVQAACGQLAGVSSVP